MAKKKKQNGDAPPSYSEATGNPPSYNEMMKKGKGGEGKGKGGGGNKGMKERGPVGKKGKGKGGRGDATGQLISQVIRGVVPKEHHKTMQSMSHALRQIFGTGKKIARMFR